MLGDSCPVEMAGRGLDGDGPDEMHQAATADLLGSSASHMVEHPPKRGRGRPKGLKGNAADPPDSGSKDGKDGKDGKAGKNAGKKMEKKCLACPRPVADPRHSSWCDLDKRALDRVRFMCKQKSPELKTWLAGILRNPSQTIELLNNYWAACGGRNKFEKCGSSPANPKWTVMEFKEEVCSENGVEARRRGLFMWEKQYVEWCQTAEGGKYSEEEGQQKWGELLRRKASGDPDLEFDYEGPRQDWIS